MKTITSNSFLLRSRFFVQGRDKYQNEERLIQIRYLNSSNEIIYNLDVDIISYTGEISELVVNGFQELIEKTKNRDHLAIVLSTPGGSATAVEKMVLLK